MRWVGVLFVTCMLSAVLPACTSTPPRPCNAIEDFCAVARLLSQRQGIGLELESGDLASPTDGLLHYQFFRTTGSPLINSIEMHEDGCIYVAYTPPTGPVWYDPNFAHDTDEGSTTVIPQGTTGRSFGRLKADNVFTNRWESPDRAMPVGHWPAPRWFSICVPPDSSPSTWTPEQTQGIPYGTLTVVLGDSGAYCQWKTAGATGPPEWSTVMTQDAPGQDNAQKKYFPDMPLNTSVSGTTNHYVSWAELAYLAQFNRLKAIDVLKFRGPDEDVYETHRVPWITSSVSGVVPNSFLSGEDYTGDHLPPEDGYWLGNPPLTEGSRFSYPESPDCGGIGVITGGLCADWIVYLKPDPEYHFMLAGTQQSPPPNPFCPSPGPNRCGSDEKMGEGNFDEEHQGSLENEIENWLVPGGYRPEPGDRMQMTGRWVTDCGHDDWHAEIHPFESFVTTHLVTMSSGGLEALNKIVVTGDWTGSNLDFDLWPPARPSPDARLQWGQIPGVMVNTALLRTTPEPADNPNHLHITIVAAPSSGTGHLVTGSRNDVYPDTPGRETPHEPSDLLVRRLATQFALWWSTG
jgi:hypothetical protein